MGRMREESIVKPRPYKKLKKERVIYIPFDSPSKILHKTIKKSALKEIDIDIGLLYLLKNKIILYRSLGAPAAVLSLEILIASGVKEIILLGFCGSLNPKFKMMAVASISKALSEEGTSKHYHPRKRIFYPSSPLKKRMEGILQASALPFFKGALVSTDAPYRETKSWLEQKQKRKIDFVDMETSAVFALANFYNIQAAALMIVSDELWGGTWKQAFNSSKLDEKIKKYFLPFINGSKKNSKY